MSIRSNGSGDHLGMTVSHGITTGDFSMGIWAKVVTARASQSIDFLTLGTEEADPVSYISTDTNADASPLVTTFDNITGAGNHNPLSAATAGTWLWLVLRRSGTTLTSLVFDDSTSTTPLTSDDQIGGGGSIATLDWLVMGQSFAGEWPDAEMANAKVHAGIAWSNAQARAESQHSAAQTGGGTFVVACSLQSLAAGLSNTGTLGGSLTNTGCVDGASNPTQLTFDGAAPSPPMFRGV